MDNRYVKIFASGSKAPLKATPGHFATNHAHINYYLDMTTLKTRLSEAQEVAKHLAERFLFDKVVDTIVCLEGTQVIGSGRRADKGRCSFYQRPQDYLCDHSGI